jgi:hypothetical protein
MIEQPPPPCPYAMVLRVDPGHPWRGPLEVDGGRITLEMLPRAKLSDPLILQICARGEVHVTISRP